jgi:hypothetical protein
VRKMKLPFYINTFSETCEGPYVTATLCEVLRVVKIQVEVFWIVTQCSVVVVHQRFRGPRYLHFALKMEAEWTSETWGYYHNKHYTASQPRISRIELLPSHCVQQHAVIIFHKI